MQLLSQTHSLKKLPAVCHTILPQVQVVVVFQAEVHQVAVEAVVVAGVGESEVAKA